ncbi:MAG: protein kinase [Planctomycetia bacterium]|nr:protein kinase [Planctomycetia bacterium]
MSDPVHVPLQLDPSHGLMSPPSRVLSAAGQVFPFLGPPDGPGEIGWLAQYRVLELRGEGGMGYVFLAEDTQLQRPVALKVMKPDRTDDLPARQRFLREARATAAIKHDHIVTIYQVGQDRDVCFLAMEWLEGKSLERWLRAGNRPGVAQILRVGREIATGLAAAHARGLIHRDIKPGNIWLEMPTGRVKLLDFGLVRVLHEDVRLTQQGIIVGTPAFMAPEQARGEPVDERGDLFSLGCVLYELCGGRLPFQGENTIATLMAVTMQEPTPLRQVNPDLPADLADLVHWLLAKRPEDRPPSAQAVVEALRALERDRAVPLAVPVAEAIQTERPLPAVSPGSLPELGASRDSVLDCSLFDTQPVLTPVPGEVALAQPPAAPRRRFTLLGGALAVGLGAALVGLLALAFRSSKELSPLAAQAAARPASTPARPPVVRPEDDWVRKTAALPAEQQVQVVVRELQRRNSGFDGRLDPVIEHGAVVKVSVTTRVVTDLAPLRALTRLRQFRGSGDNIGNGQLTDLSPLRGLPLQRLEIHNNPPLTDLTPLAGMPLESLNLNHTNVRDLSPLAGMPLYWLSLWQAPVRDLSPLRGCPLKHLVCVNTGVRDLSPLAGMKLHALELQQSPLDDIRPLQKLPVQTLNFDYRPWRDRDVLLAMTTLTRINGRPAAKFWMDAEVEQALFDAWAQQTANLRPEEQIAAFAAKLREHNPKFSGRIGFGVENGRLVELSFAGHDITDLAPLRGVPTLKRLIVAGTAAQPSPLADLSPLRGLPLMHLDCSHSQVRNLEPLAGLPLRSLAGDIQPERDGAVLRQLLSLQTINGRPLAEFWLAAKSGAVK